MIEREIGKGMEGFIIVLILLIAIAISNVVNHFIPKIPVPLIQIALGSIFALLPLGINIRLEPELFFVLFVAPILFNDGKMIPKSRLWKLKIPILLLALGLVFATVIIGGYLVYWLIPDIPLPAAFALAAILSPTDAVAVSALSKKSHINKNIMTLLEGEALINDASGLVAFKFAVAATVTGAFSIKSAMYSFLILAFGGLAIGALVALIIIKFRIYLRRLGMEDVTLHMLIQILTPFLVYLVAEHFSVSGILAVVAGGIIHSIEKKRVESSTLELQIMSENTWSLMMFILNGLVFVLLGLQIPAVARAAYYNQEINTIKALGYVLLISVSLIIIRYIWIYLCWKPADIIGRRTGKHSPKPKTLLLISISGVRGAVTLAAAFSIPYMLQNGSSFPQRDLIIFLAAGVILTSLVIASIFLPLLSRRDKPSGATRRISPEQVARIKLMRAVIKAMKEEMDSENKAAALSIISDSHRVIWQIAHKERGAILDISDKTAETKIWVIALNAEKTEIQAMHEEGLIDKKTVNRLLQSVNYREMLLTKKYKYKLIYLLTRILSVVVRNRNAQLQSFRDTDTMLQIKIRIAKAAVDAVNNQMDNTNNEICHYVLSHYNQAIRKFNAFTGSFITDQKEIIKKKELQYKAIQIQRKEVQLLFEKGEISLDTANKLRRFINYTEASLLQENEIMEV